MDKDISHKENLELAKIMNDYMISKKWDLEQSLTYLTSVLLRTCQLNCVSKALFEYNLERMKNVYEMYLDQPSEESNG